jgi:hypothetical protein
LANPGFARKIQVVPVDRQQLPKDANVLQQMVLDLVAQLDTEQSRRIKVERLLV